MRMNDLNPSRHLRAGLLLAAATLTFASCTREDLRPEAKPSLSLSSEVPGVATAADGGTLAARAAMSDQIIGLIQRKNAGENVDADARLLLDQIHQHPELYQLAVSDDAALNRSTISGVIDPNQYECNSSNIPLTNYVNSTVADWESLDILIYSYYSGYIDYYEIYINDGSKQQVYGPNGEYTQVLTKTFKDLRRFWDINSDGMLMVAMKGNAFADIDGIAKMFNLVFGVSEAGSYNNALILADYFGRPAFWNYTHPLLSFNAYAISNFLAPPFNVPDKIAMGDGILMGYEEIGFGDVAPQAILAHEYAHQVQFDNPAFRAVASVPADRPNATRFNELMADAFASYYLTHKRGATFNAKRVAEFLQVFYNIGDCSFASSGHHGTYNQRLGAAEFGFKVADQTWPKGHILTAKQFFDLFVASYDDILNAGPGGSL